jgi:rod shape-determining protein MreC
VRYPTVGRPERQRRDLALVLVLSMLAIVLTSLGPEARLPLTLALRSTVLAPFLAAHRAAEDRAMLRATAARLGEERDALARRALADADLEEENRQLRELLSIRRREPGGFFVGELAAGAPAAGESHGFLLQLDRSESVRPPVGVGTPSGLVGVVRTVRGDVATGDFWTHPDFRVAVRTSDATAAGIVRPTPGESGPPLMLLEGVAYQAELAPGTLLVTSGIGGVYPPGISVGRVIQEAASHTGWSRSYLVEPAVRPGQVRVVMGWQPPLVPFRPADGAAGSASDSGRAVPSPDPARSPGAP